MANPTCDRDTLVASAGCLAALNENERKAMKIYFMASQLAAIGGTDYRDTLSTTLVSDVACLVPLDMNQREIARLSVESNNATAAGASISTNIQTLALAIACLKNVPGETMDAMEILLRCKLGRGKTYPQ